MPLNAIVLSAALGLAVAAPASAYIGPGAGLTVIGTAMAFVGTAAVMLVGFVWYPLRRLLAALRSRRDASPGPDAPQP